MKRQLISKRSLERFEKAGRDFVEASRKSFEREMRIACKIIFNPTPKAKR